MSLPFYNFARFVCWLFFGTLYRMRRADGHTVPKTGPVIIACNHVSYYDPPVLGTLSPRAVTYMAKQELFHIPVLGPIITWLGAFPVDRSRGDVAAMKAALKVLKSGACLGIFPEGTRNIDGTVKAQLGVAMIAQISGATVIPAYVSGTAHLKKFNQVGVKFGEPLRFEPGRKASREDLAKWTDELMSRIYALRENPVGH